MIIRTHDGTPVATNAVKRSSGCIQVVLAHDSVIEAFEIWLGEANIVLLPIPAPTPNYDGLPTYGLTPIDEGFGPG